MKDIGYITGMEYHAKPLVVEKDTVYVHTDIQEIKSEGEKLFKYYEVQYDKDEYIQMMFEKTNEQDTLINSLFGGEDNE